MLFSCDDCTLCPKALSLTKYDIWTRVSGMSPIENDVLLNSVAICLRYGCCYVGAGWHQ